MSDPYFSSRSLGNSSAAGSGQFYHRGASSSEGGYRGRGGQHNRSRGGNRHERGRGIGRGRPGGDGSSRGFGGRRHSHGNQRQGHSNRSANLGGYRFFKPSFIEVPWNFATVTSRESATMDKDEDLHACETSDDEPAEDHSTSMVDESAMTIEASERQQNDEYTTVPAGDENEIDLD